MDKRECAQALAEARGHPVPGQPCAFHDQSIELLRATIQDLRDQMRQAFDAVTAQSRANGKTLAHIADSQVIRRELCARQTVRLDVAERDIQQSRIAAEARGVEYWEAINELRKLEANLRVKVYQYVGLGTGVGLVVSMIAQLALKHFLS